MYNKLPAFEFFTYWNSSEGSKHQVKEWKELSWYIMQRLQIDCGGAFHLYFFPFNFPFIYISKWLVQKSFHKQLKIVWYGVLLKTWALYCCLRYREMTKTSNIQSFELPFKFKDIGNKNWPVQRVTDKTILQEFQRPAKTGWGWSFDHQSISL